MVAAITTPQPSQHHSLHNTTAFTTPQPSQHHSLAVQALLQLFRDGLSAERQNNECQDQPSNKPPVKGRQSVD
jgi:hypothetical protein